MLLSIAADTRLNDVKLISAIDRPRPLTVREAVCVSDDGQRHTMRAQQLPLHCPFSSSNANQLSHYIAVATHFV